MHGTAEGRADGGIAGRRRRAAEDVRVEEEGGGRQGRRRVGRRVGPVWGEGLVCRQVMLGLNVEGY